jgi:hypothetical protein
MTSDVIFSGKLARLNYALSGFNEDDATSVKGMINAADRSCERFAAKWSEEIIRSSIMPDLIDFLKGMGVEEDIRKRIVGDLIDIHNSRGEQSEHTHCR